MPLATPAQYAELLDAAKAGGYAVPAITRALAEHMFVDYAGVVRPEQTMAARVVEVCRQLGSAGGSLTGR
jgi:hypothetical protein